MSRLASTSFEIIRDEIHALADDDLVTEARRLLDEARNLEAALRALIEDLLGGAEHDLHTRWPRRKLRADARGRLRTFCLNMRINEQRRR